MELYGQIPRSAGRRNRMNRPSGSLDVDIIFVTCPRRASSRSIATKGRCGMARQPCTISLRVWFTSAMGNTNRTKGWIGRQSSDYAPGRDSFRKNTIALANCRNCGRSGGKRFELWLRMSRALSRSGQVENSLTPRIAFPSRWPSGFTPD